MTTTKNNGVDLSRADVPRDIHSFLSRHGRRAWAIDGREFSALLGAQAGRMPQAARGEEKVRSEMTLQDWRSELAYWAPQRQPLAMERDTGLAFLDVRGALVDDDGPLWIAALGLTTWAELQADIAALHLAGAKGVLVTINSPGGMCAGCSDTAQALADLARGIPVVVHAETYLASAAYALAAGATEIWSSPSALVGCIGTFLGLLDVSGYWEEMGVKDDYIQNTGGDLKSAGRPPNQTPEERAALQEEIDDFFAQFRDHVLAHRNLTADTMRGQCFVADPRGLALNVVDHIGTRAAAFARLKQLVG